MDQGAEDSRDSLAKETDPTIPWVAGGGVQHLWFASSPKPPLICILFVLLREGEEEQRRG